MLEETVLTNEEKRGAIQASATMAIRPLVPISPENITEKKGVFANQQLALRWAAAVVTGPPLRPLREERLRFYNNLARLQFPSLIPFIKDFNDGRDTQSLAYNVNLSDAELFELDAVVFQIESFARRRPA